MHRFTQRLTHTYAYTYSALAMLLETSVQSPPPLSCLADLFGLSLCLFLSLTTLLHLPLFHMSLVFLFANFTTRLSRVSFPATLRKPAYVLVFFAVNTQTDKSVQQHVHT